MTPFALNGGSASSEASDGAVAYRIGFVLFIFALLLRIAAIEATGAGVVRFGDGLDYLSAARAVCEQGTYPERSGLPFFRAPGLPFFIAAATACNPTHVRLVKYALAACDAGTVVLIFLMAQFLWRGASSDPRFSAVPFFAAVLAAFQPLQVAATTDIRSEPLFTFLLTGSMWLLLRRRMKLSGVAIALAALVRPTALLGIPLFAIYLWWRPGSTGSKRVERTAPALAFLAAAILMLAPWTIRNAVRFGELIVVNDAAGFNLWRGTHPDLIETVRTMDPAEFSRRSVHFETITVAEAARVVDARATTPGARNREWKRMAWENVRSDTDFALRATLEKALMYWRPWLHPAEHGGPAMALSLMVSMTLFIGGAIGMAQYPDRRFVVAVLAFFAAMWLAHLPYLPTIRLRMPLVDPLLTVFTAGALSAATVRLRKDWKAYLPLLLVFVPIIALAIVATQLADVPAAGAVVTAIRKAAGEWWAMPLFVIAYAISTLFLLPLGLLSAAAALAWGWKVGGTLELVTCTISAIVPYLLARRGMAGWIERRLSKQEVPALDSTFILLILRIVPIVPYVALNYIAGALKVRPRDYVLTTLFGSIPSVFLFAYFIDTMAEGALGIATQARLVAVCVLVAVVAIVLRLAAKRLRGRAVHGTGDDAVR